MQNKILTVELSSSGLLDSVDVASSGTLNTLQLGQDLMLYWGNGGREAPSSGWDSVGGDGGSESDAVLLLHLSMM